jgi:hypothetical protein
MVLDDQDELEGDLYVKMEKTKWTNVLITLRN